MSVLKTLCFRGGTVRCYIDVVCKKRKGVTADCLCIEPKKKKEKLQVKAIKTGTDTEYGVLNVQVSGHDMTIVEHYSQYVHNLCNRLKIKVDESYALPTKCTEVMLLQEQGTKMFADAVLSTHERIVQLSGLSSTLAPVFLEVLLRNQPEGVQLSIKESSVHYKASPPDGSGVLFTTVAKRKSTVYVRIVKMEARILLQNDWPEALRKNEGEAWVACKIPGKPTVYGTLKSQGVSDDGCLEITASEEFRVLGVSKLFVRNWVYILDWSVSGNNDTGQLDCDIFIQSSTQGADGPRVRCELLQVLPLGHGGSERRDGHSGQGILDTAVVERGRNVLSCSRDGTARLWDCGKSVCLAVVADCGAPINGCSVGVADNTINQGSPEEPSSDREVGTEDKLLLLAREDKKLQAVGLQSRQPLSGLSSTLAPVFLEVLLRNQPEGVQLSIKEHTEADFYARFKARPELEELIAQIN
ncbi:39S ribosomal protein L48, mitochondrial [Acipenser ruthenus]|uniref:Large ribosomal subunit protein mL48 n=1 Tax=Acipenser ruthenus TaxID=7906 RepID=A0A662YN69_ACIRT|nr:39S ribosomal protein L48, mitochondrial [Acipenser ruthenus]